MSKLIKALLIAGLFICANAFAVPIGEPAVAKREAFTECTGLAVSGPSPTFRVRGHITDSACSLEATKRYQSVYVQQINKNNTNGCPAKIKEDHGSYFVIQFYYMNETHGCMPSSTTAASVSSTAIKQGTDEVCPPEGPAWTEHIDGPYPNPDPKLTNKVCYQRAKPLGCGALKGLSTDSTKDYFLAKADAYTGSQQPSCVTKCGKDVNGNTSCGNCKVVAKSWIQAASGGGMVRWRPLVGTLTGASCGDNEQDTPPPDQPKCWQTKNNLKMCQQDPAEKCVTVNGTMKCEEGCGYVNGDFFCADKPAPSKPPKDDKPLPEPDDTLPDPDKPLNQMVKKDFKDVQRGVESRLAVVGAGIGNVENSIDESNALLEGIQDTLSESLDTQKQILDGVGDLSGGGECDPQTDPNCTPPPCDPLKELCDGFATGPKSWWTKKYPDGLKSVFEDKKQQFMASEAYAAMQFDSKIPSGGGTSPKWNFCLNLGAMGSFGCTELQVPPYVWGFIKVCMLFGAAILCRRLIIGA